MSDVNVRITSKACPTGECITVPNGDGVVDEKITAKKSSLIIFDNKLTTEAEVYFYPDNKDKVGHNNAIDDFCTTENGAAMDTDPLRIPPGEIRRCKINKGWWVLFNKEYYYRIVATNYTELDPVIIIKPRFFANLLVFFVVLLSLLGLSLWGIQELMTG